MQKPKGKRLVYVEAELLDEALKVAGKRGESIGKFVEESLRHSVRTESTGFDLEKVAEFFEVLQAQRNLGGSFVPEEVLSHLTETICAADRRKLEDKWFESGKWTGKYLREKFSDPIQALKSFLQATRWDLNEVQVKSGPQSLRIVCVSTVLTSEATTMLSKFLEGIVESLGFTKTKTDNMKGMLVLEAVR